MNLLFSYYKDKNTITKWFEKYTSVSKENIMYAYKGTNGRELLSMIDVFKKMEEIENIPRTNWPRSERTGQEVHKQYPIPMITTKLFYKEDTEKGIYKKTEKGKRYRQFINTEFGDEDKWIINYIFLLDSFIQNKENYLITRSVEIRNKIIKYVAEDRADSICYEFLKNINKYNNIESLFNSEYLFLNMFYNEPEFLKLFNTSTLEEIKEISDYAILNYNTSNYNCCISKKFKPGGQYTINMVKDDIKVYCFSNLLSKIKFVDFESTLSAILKLYKNYFYFNYDKVYNYLEENKDIIEPILMNVFNVEDIKGIEEVDIEEYVGEFHETVENVISSDVPEPRIDDTTIEGKRKLQKIFVMRKRIAREVSNYKCELEDLRGCRYFTSKTTKNNYVEIHHFVPREFRNNFANSIDVLANYICLCPSCHRMIHLATDRERVDIIRYIFNKRHERLSNCGLIVEFKDLLDYYNVENES